MEQPTRWRVTVGEWEWNLVAVGGDLPRALSRRLEPLGEVTPGESQARITLALCRECPGDPVGSAVAVQVDPWTEGELWSSGSSSVLRTQDQALIVVTRSDGDVVIRVWHPVRRVLLDAASRVIRQLIIGCAEQHGWLHVHGSAAILPSGGAVAVLGDSGGGKSTVLLELIKEFGASPVACDMFLLNVRQWPFRVIGIPTAFNLCYGTVASYPELHHLFPPAFRPLTLSEVWRLTEKEDLSMAVVCEAFGADVVRSGPLECLIGVRFGQHGPSEWTPVVDPVRVETSLRQACLGSAVYRDWAALFPPPETPSVSAALHDASVRLADAGSVYDLHWGPSVDSLMLEIPVFRRRHRWYGHVLEPHACEFQRQE